MTAGTTVGSALRLQVIRLSDTLRLSSVRCQMLHGLMSRMGTGGGVAFARKMHVHSLMFSCMVLYPVWKLGGGVALLRDGAFSQ